METMEVVEVEAAVERLTEAVKAEIGDGYDVSHKKDSRTTGWCAVPS